MVVKAKGIVAEYLSSIGVELRDLEEALVDYVLAEIGDEEPPSLFLALELDLGKEVQTSIVTSPMKEGDFIYGYHVEEAGETLRVGKKSTFGYIASTDVNGRTRIKRSDKKTSALNVMMNISNKMIEIVLAFAGRCEQPPTIENGSHEVICIPVDTIQRHTYA